MNSFSHARLRHFALCCNAPSSMISKLGFCCNWQWHSGHIKGFPTWLTNHPASMPQTYSPGWIYSTLNCFLHHDCTIVLFHTPFYPAAWLTLWAVSSCNLIGAYSGEVLHIRFAAAAASSDLVFRHAISTFPRSFSTSVSGCQTWKGPFQPKPIIPQHITDEPCFLVVLILSACHHSVLSRQTSKIMKIPSTSTHISSVKLTFLH